MHSARSERQRIFQLNLGRAVRHLRKDHDLRQREVSRRSTLSVEYLSRLENGRANPTILTLLALIEDGMGDNLGRFCHKYMTGSVSAHPN